MSRPYRILGENEFYHITSRGNGRRNIYNEDKDYIKFLDYLVRVKEKFQFRLYAYVLMTNHYHLLIQTLQANLHRIMHYINGSYTTYYNKIKRNTGHLFQGRYKSLIVDADSYFKELTRYIHLNPVKAKIAEKPEEYRWSSYKGYLSGKGDGYIDKEAIKNVLCMSVNEYKRFVCSGITEKEDIFKDVYAGSMLGGASFIKEKIEELKLQMESVDISYLSRYKGSIEAEDIVDYISSEYKIKKEDLLKSKNKQNQAKKNCIYLLKRLTGSSNKEIGKTFNISYSAVSKAGSSFEEEMLKNKKTKKLIESQVSHFKG